VRSRRRSARSTRKWPSTMGYPKSPPVLAILVIFARSFCISVHPHTIRVSGANYSFVRHLWIDQQSEKEGIFCVFCSSRLYDEIVKNTCYIPSPSTSNAPIASSTFSPIFFICGWLLYLLFWLSSDRPHRRESFICFSRIDVWFLALFFANARCGLPTSTRMSHCKSMQCSGTGM